MRSSHPFFEHFSKRTSLLLLLPPLPTPILLAKPHGNRKLEETGELGVDTGRPGNMPVVGIFFPSSPPLVQQTCFPGYRLCLSASWKKETATK